MDYDVLILGGGLVGCAVAYELSKYSLNIALIERDYDIAHDVALTNTALVYNGIETENSLTYKLEDLGNNMMDMVTSKFNIPFKRRGTLFIAKNEEEEKRLDEMYNRAIQRGIKDVYIIDKESIGDIEPHLDGIATKAIYTKSTGVVCPYDLALAYGEIAFDNNVNFKLQEEVLDIKKIARGFRVVTNKSKFTCKMVINTISGESYSVEDNTKTQRNTNGKPMKYYTLDEKYKNFYSDIIFNINDNERISIVPTVSGDILGSISADYYIDDDTVIDRASKLIKDLNSENIDTFMESKFHDEDIIIDDSSIDIGYIIIRGKHYGMVTMTPAIASNVCETVISKMNCKLKKDFVDKRREVYKFKELSNDERQKLIEMDKKYGKVVCLCEMVTEGEIIDAIRRPLGARTVEGIKRRTGATFGKCQGAHCLNKVVAILARETNKKVTDIVKDSKESKIISNRIKEFDTV